MTVFLGILKKLRKATNSFVVSVCLSVPCSSLLPHGTWAHWEDFMKFGVLVFFENLCKKQVSLKSDNNNECFT
jgi:hypothetical protein